MIASRTAMRAEEMKYLEGASFTGSFQLIGTLSNPSVLFVLTNNTGFAVDLSLDGTTRFHYMPDGCALTIDVSTNKNGVGFGGNGILYLPNGSTLYGRTTNLTAPFTFTAFH